MKKKTKQYRNLTRLTMAFLCLFLLCPAALAVHTGSLQVELEGAGAGMTVTLYYVAEKDGSLTEDFGGAGLTKDQILDERQHPKSAAVLYRHLRKYEPTGEGRITDPAGTVRFEGLDEGTYLVCGRGGNVVFDPFLVTIPTKMDDLIIYDIESSPKVDLSDQPNDPAPPGPELEPEAPVIPDDPSGHPDEETDIPQTGMILWPMYSLLALGLLLILMGAITTLRRCKKHDE